MDGAPLWAFALFSLVGSFTPGPNNAIATATAANFGFRAALPHIFGVPFGFSTMLALGSLGVVSLVMSVPAAAGVLKWTGVAYLVYLGARLMRAGPHGAPTAQPLTFLQSALFQYANPKAWMLAAATAGTYMTGGRLAPRAALICGVFAATCIASLVVWAWMGAALRQWLSVGRRRRWFNAAMGLALAATALWMAATT